MEGFPSDVRSRIGWYVYRLIDPRNGNTFYVGKGKDNRVFEHAHGSLRSADVESDDEQLVDLKKGTIREIHNAGLRVLYVIHRHGFKEEAQAYEVEAALIDAYPGLTNRASGHCSFEFGCRSADEIVAAYKAIELVVKEPLILIFVGKTRDRDSIYDSVRGVWKMKKTRAEKYRLVLAYDGVLCTGVFRPEEWLPATKANFPFLKKDVPDRIGFKGHEADVLEEYYGKRVPARRKGDMSAFRYLAPPSHSKDEIL